MAAITVHVIGNILRWY